MGPRRRKEKGAENLFEEITAENFPNLKKKTGIQVQETQKVPDKITLPPKKPHQNTYN